MIILVYSLSLQLNQSILTTNIYLVAVHRLPSPSSLGEINAKRICGFPHLTPFQNINEDCRSFLGLNFVKASKLTKKQLEIRMHRVEKRINALVCLLENQEQAFIFSVVVHLVCTSE